MYDDYCSDLNEAGSVYFLLPGTMYGDDWSDLNEAVPFSAAEVKTLMLRPGSKLRTITFGGISYFVSRVFGQICFPSYLAFLFYFLGEMGACYARARPSGFAN